MHTYKRKTQSPGFALLIALSATAIGVLPLSGNQAETTPWRISIGQVASVVGAMSVGFIPTIFSINDTLPTVRLVIRRPFLASIAGWFLPKRQGGGTPAG